MSVRASSEKGQDLKIWIPSAEITGSGVVGTDRYKSEINWNGSCRTSSIFRFSLLLLV